MIKNPAIRNKRNEWDNEKIKNIPKLRFPEFNGNWKNFALSELGDFKNGINKSKNDFGKGNPFVNLEDIFENRSLKSKNFNLVKVSEKELKEYDLKKGDVLFVRSSVKPEGVGLTSVLLENLVNTVYSGFIIRFRSNEKLNLLFKQFCFSTFPIRKQILAKCSTSANTNINQESLKKITINIPNLNEQMKIADFLSTIDSKIELMEKKYNCLIKTRKYFLNSLFCYNENIPQLRFVDFNTTPFKKVKIEDIFSKVRNGFVGTATPYYVEKGIPYLQSNNVRRNKIDKTNMIFINHEFHNKHEKSILKENDIVMVQSGHAGECAVIPKSLEGSNCHALIVMTPKDLKTINSTYCAYYLNSSIGIKQIFPLITGNTIKHILASELKKMTINIPSSEEQNKIADFLSTIDRKIELMEKEIKYNKKFKETLLNKMFC